MRLLSFSMVLAACLWAGGPALGASQPDHRPSGDIIWFQPSRVIIEGTHLIENGRVEEGMAMIRQEMEKDLHRNDRESGHNNLCVGHLLLKQFDEALKQCSITIGLKPSMWQGYNNRGNARLALGDVAGAIPDCEKALELNPDSITVQGNLDLAKRRLAELKKH